jgi:elongation factor Ts
MLQEAKKEAPKQEEASAPQVAVSAKMVKELRNSTGAGMMDCKKALAASNNNLQAAEEWLAKKGIASAGKKAGRTAAEGVIQAYVHTGSKIGVLMEVNSESDFVAKNETFLALAEDMAMQVSPKSMHKESLQTV